MRSFGLKAVTDMTTRKITVTGAVVAAIGCFAAGAYTVEHFSEWLRNGFGAATEASAQSSSSAIRTAALPFGPPSVELNDKQLQSVKVEPVGDRLFPVEKSAVGSIDFNEELETQVFTPYRGKIINVFAKVGDEVKQGQTLFTGPDLLNADSDLIAAAGVLELLTRNLARLRTLYETTLAQGTLAEIELAQVGQGPRFVTVKAVSPRSNPPRALWSYAERLQVGVPVSPKKS